MNTATNTKTNLRAVSARTTNSNTPESDMQTFVPHTVRMSDGSERTIMAREPGDAIDKVNRSLQVHGG